MQSFDAIAVANLIGIVFPNPTQGVREDYTAMDVGMAAFSPNVSDLVAWAGDFFAVRICIGKFHRGQHLLVRKKPIPVLVAQIIGTILQKYSDRFDWVLADQGGIELAT